MHYSPHIWNQIKNITADELIKALLRDGWIRDEGRGAILVYRHFDGRRITVHYHPQKTYGPKLLKGLLDDIGWNEDDLRRLKLVR